MDQLLAADIFPGAVGRIQASGIGRELGRWGLGNYLEVKQVTRFKRGHTWDWYGDKAHPS